LVVKEVSALEPKPLTTGEREEARKRRVRIEQFERLKRDIAGLRNKIESAVYDVRSNLLEEEQYKPYYKKEDKTGLEKFADEVDEWLSGESDDVTSEKYTAFSDKHQALKNLVDPIYERYQESSRREKVVDNCEKVFNQTRSMLEQITRNSPWVPELDVNEVLQQVRDVEAWVRETLAKQGRTALSEAPIALAEEYKEKCAKPLSNAVKLFKTPKPKVETIKVNETTTAEPKNETQEEVKQEEVKPEQPKDEL
jgi:sulfur relay (sulfurtransferase) DsrC/TusE family protein